MAIDGGNWGIIRTVSPGDYYDYIAACDGEADGHAVYALYHLVDASGFSKYKRLYDTSPSNGCTHVDWRGTQYWARAVAICEESLPCSAWVFIPDTPSTGKPTGKPTS
jgi:hypothetical protein